MVNQENLYLPEQMTIQTKPKALVFMARRTLLLRMAFVEYSGMYRREMQVLAVGKWSSSAGRIVMLGIGWNPSSLAGKAGLDVQKYTWRERQIVSPIALLSQKEDRFKINK